jgi:fatty acid desaturase
MKEQDANLPVIGDPRALAQSLARYCEPSCARSVVEIAITALPLVLLWLLMWASLDISFSEPRTPASWLHPPLWLLMISVLTALDTCIEPQKRALLHRGPLVVRCMKTETNS